MSSCGVGFIAFSLKIVRLSLVTIEGEWIIWALLNWACYASFLSSSVFVNRMVPYFTVYRSIALSGAWLEAISIKGVSPSSLLVLIDPVTSSPFYLTLRGTTFRSYDSRKADPASYFSCDDGRPVWARLSSKSSLYGGSFPSPPKD